MPYRYYPGFPPGAYLLGAQRSAVVHRERANEFYAYITPTVAALRRQGLSLRKIAAELDRHGIRTRQERQRWSATQIVRVLERCHAGLPAGNADGEFSKFGTIEKVAYPVVEAAQPGDGIRRLEARFKWSYHPVNPA